MRDDLRKLCDLHVRGCTERTHHWRCLELQHMLTHELPQTGYTLTTPADIRREHVVALMRHWEANCRQAATVLHKVGSLRWLGNALGNPDLIPTHPAAALRGPDRYRRPRRMQTAHAFTGLPVGVGEAVERVAEIDPRIAALQRLKLAFGLRHGEARRLRPHEADKGTHLLVNVRGSTGRQTRTVLYYDFEGGFDPVGNRVLLWNVRVKQECVDAIEHAKQFAAGRRGLIPPDYTPARFSRYERHVLAKAGFTRSELGATPTNLREEYLSRRIEAVSGVPRPLNRTAPLTLDQCLRDRVGRQIAAIEGGYTKAAKLDMFFGLRGESAPNGVCERIREYLIGPAREPLLKPCITGRVIGGGGRCIVVRDTPPVPVEQMPVLSTRERLFLNRQRYRARMARRAAQNRLVRR